MRKILFVCSRLWRFNNLYFLKPNDAINDTLTASLLIDFDWSGEIVEIGSGDGVFNYVLHGGYFPLNYDRYSQVDLKKNDIYDTHLNETISPQVVLDFPKILISVDKKKSHLQKVSEIGFSKKTIQCEYENLPFLENSVNKISYYVPHDVIDYEKALKNAFKILKPGGRLILLTYDDCFKPYFICHRLSDFFRGNLSKYFKDLDNGRYFELSKISKSRKQWKDFFNQNGMQIEVMRSGLSQFAWAVYDTQTRPFLKFFINLLNNFSPLFRTLLKTFIMLFTFPYLLLFYMIFTNQYFLFGGKNCYRAYQLRKK